VACLPAVDPDTMPEELAYVLDMLHLDGVALTSNVDGRYLGDPWWQPMRAQLDHRAVTLVNPVNCPHATELSVGPIRSSSSPPSTPLEQSPTPCSLPTLILE
jgi:hypothetical protein